MFWTASSKCEWSDHLRHSGSRDNPENDNKLDSFIKKHHEKNYERSSQSWQGSHGERMLYECSQDVQEEWKDTDAACSSTPNNQINVSKPKKTL